MKVGSSTIIALTIVCSSELIGFIIPLRAHNYFDRMFTNNTAMYVRAFVCTRDG
jgi:hypothetical protein